VCQIPFADILVIELGEALTLGWLVVRFVISGDAADQTIFFQSSGIDHFRAAVRAWRRNGSRAASSEPSAEAWEQLWSRTPPYLRNQSAPLLLEEGRPCAVLHIAETWCRLAGRRPPVCVSAAGLCVVTDSTVLLVQSEQPYRPGALVFAVNVTCIDRRVIRDVVLLRRDSPSDQDAVLAFDVEEGTVRHQVSVSVGRSAVRDVEDLLTEFVEPTSHAD
jgi:hypothetical protein